MKKLMFFVMACFAMTFAACGGQTASNENATEGDTLVVANDTTVVDTLVDVVEVVDTVVAE